MSNINSTQAYQSKQATVSNTVMTLVDFGFTAEELERASRIYVFVNSGAVRIDYSGNSPNTITGAHILSTFELSGNQNITNFKIIRNGTINSEVFIILED